MNANDLLTILYDTKLKIISTVVAALVIAGCITSPSTYSSTAVPSTQISPSITQMTDFIPTPSAPVYPTIPTQISIPIATIAPTPIPTPTPEKKSRKRVVFLSGLCSPDPKKTFGEISDWLVKNVGLKDSDFDYYNYTEKGDPGKTYEPKETLKAIGGDSGSAQNLRNFLIRQHNAYPNSKFVLITHSLGGVVALYALDQYRELGFVENVLTIESPVQGEDTKKLRALGVLPCIASYVIKHGTPPVLLDLEEDSDVIKVVKQTKYIIKPFNVIILVNTNDPIFISDDHPYGELGLLPDVFTYRYSFGRDQPKTIVDQIKGYAEVIGTSDIQHSLPLFIETLDRNGKTEAAGLVATALRCAVINDCDYRTR